MKKFWMNLLCLLLALSLVFCLCACGDEGYEEEDDEDDEETSASTDSTGDPTDPGTDPTDPGPATPANPLVGHWEWDMDMTEHMNTMMSMTEMAGYIEFTDVVFCMDFVINEDGTYSMYIDETATQSKAATMKQEFKTGYSNYLSALLAANNISMTLEEFLLTQSISLDTEAENFVNGMMDSFGDMDETGIYKVENGKLYVTEDTTFDEEDGRPYTLEDNKLIIECPEESPWPTMDFVRVS